MINKRYVMYLYVYNQDRDSWQRQFSHSMLENYLFNVHFLRKDKGKCYIKLQKFTQQFSSYFYNVKNTPWQFVVKKLGHLSYLN